MTCPCVYLSKDLPNKGSTEIGESRSKACNPVKRSGVFSIGSRKVLSASETKLV